VINSPAYISSPPELFLPSVSELGYLAEHLHRDPPRRVAFFFLLGLIEQKQDGHQCVPSTPATVFPVLTLSRKNLEQETEFVLSTPSTIPPPRLH